MRVSDGTFQDHLKLKTMIREKLNPITLAATARRGACTSKVAVAKPLEKSVYPTG